MKELIEKILPYLPRYLGELGAVLVRPKRFLTAKKLASADAFVESLVFCALSIALTVALTTPLFPGRELWLRMSEWAVGAVLGLALFAAALHVSWRAVGARVPVRRMFVNCAYLYGAACVLLALVLLLFAGTFRAFEPELYARFVSYLGRPLERGMVDRAVFPPMSRDTAARMLAILAIFVVGQIAIAAWMLVAWGAFRELARVSRWRSVGALLIVSLLAVPVFAIVTFVTNAMM